MVAVKRLDRMLKPGVQDRQFENEVYHLMRLKHPNIVQFLGYCYETQNECVEHDGKYIFAEMQKRLICLEYLPNGSLDKHLSDASSGHEWHTRYKIIKGICCGLLYLHEECQSQFSASIIHLDLKPGNILLDEHMRPKIADFGLSRLFKDNKTQTCATFLSGSLGYMAPEYLIGRIVTAKADIYNFGVIILEIITGSKVSVFKFGSPTTYQEFMDGVINNWRNRLGGAPSETDCKQIKHCVEIGLCCIKLNREERPTSREIMERLDRWETMNCNVNSGKRPSTDQILTHTEEKPSDSTSGHETIFSAVQPNNISGPRLCGSLNRSRPRGFFHRQLSRVMRFLQFSKLSSLTPEVARHRPPRLPSKEFTFAQMEAATTGFSLELMIGEGSFGTVYRGCLPDGREVAIKRGYAKIGEPVWHCSHCIGSVHNVYYHPDGREVAIKYGQSGPRDRRFQESQFLWEVAFLSRLRHKHIVDLVGYCAENKERLLVCEYMRNGALYDHLHRPPSEPSPSSMVMSSWKLRIRILLDASRGIDYLHSYADDVPPIIHRDITSSNILLDASWRARVSGFGLSIMESEAREHLTNEKLAGTFGYMDPEYCAQLHLTVKSDVYGFGMVMLEVLTGKRPSLNAIPSIDSGELGKVLDPRAPEPAAHEAKAVELVAFTAMHCVRLEGKDRPAIADIVANLEIAFELCEGSFDGDLESPSGDNLPVITPIDQD